MSRRGNPASRIVHRRQLKNPRLSRNAHALRRVVARYQPIHTADAGVLAGLTERSTFFAASELLEFEQVRIADDGLVIVRR